MSDFIFALTPTCHSNKAWSRDVEGSKGAIYTVRWAFQFEGSIQFAWECSCPAFKYRNAEKKECKHITRVKGERCGWNALLNEGHVGTRGEFRGYVCPKCSGPVDLVEVVE